LPEYFSRMELKEFILKALAEDIGSGDSTSLACVDANASGKAQLLIKDSGILAGMRIAKYIFDLVDEKISFNNILSDGDKIKSGDIAFEIKGNIQNILKTERTVLNIMQRMSGIATETFKYVEQVKGLKTKILDTRKTTPLFREFEKEAVRIGGGFNHRMGLYDMIMIKDNHIDAAGGINNAIEKVNQYQKENKTDLKVEIEVRNLSEVEEVLIKGGVLRIMLDNFEIGDLKKAVELINHKYETEASGGINLQNVRSYAETGVDFISIGALTHSYKSLDMSLKIKKD